jgi:hypothetical protein
MNPDENNALIAKDISYIQKDISDIKTSVKELANVYATKGFVDDAFKALGLRLDSLEKSSNLWKWLSPTLSSILAAGITFLIIQYISHGGK